MNETYPIAKFSSTVRVKGLLATLIILVTVGLRAQERLPRNGPDPVESLLVTLADYEYDGSRAWLPQLRSAMMEVYKDPANRTACEDLMIGFLQSDATHAGKQHVCRELGIIGSGASVPTLYNMLSDPDLVGTALRTLEKIPGKEADDALLKALEIPDPEIQVAVVNALAARKVISAEKSLEKVIRSPHPVLVQSGLSALGALGTQEASNILEDFIKEPDPGYSTPALDAWMKCAYQLLAVGEPEEVRVVFERIYLEAPSYPVKHSAMVGLFQTSTEDPHEFVISKLRDENPEFHSYIVSLIVQSDKVTDIERIFSSLTDLPEKTEILLISAAGQKRDQNCRERILSASRSEDQDKRTAAIWALGGTGKPEDVTWLASLANEKGGKEQAIARQSLYMLRGNGFSETILQEISKNEGGIKAELIKSTGERNMHEAIDQLFGTARDENSKVRLESIRALGKLVPPERIDEVVLLLGQAGNRRERQETERAIYAIVLKNTDASKRSGPITNGLSELNDPAAKASLIGILGMIGDNENLEMLRTYLNSDNEVLHEAALKSLCAWPNAAPVNDLKEILHTTSDNREHTLALRGYVDMVIADPEMEAVTKLSEVKHAYSMASNLQEKKIVLSGLSRIGTIDALQFAITLMDETDLQKEAEVAVVTIATSTSWGYPSETLEELSKVLPHVKDEANIGRIHQIMDRIK